METQLNFTPGYKPTKLKTLPLRDQPAYRVASNANGCNLAELLAAVVGGGQQIEIAEGLLSHFGGDIQRIYKANVAEIAQVHGIGQQMAVRLKAALTLAIRLHEPTGERPVINSPSDAAFLVQYEMGLLEQEHLRVLLLDTRNRVLDIVEVYCGSVNSSQIRVAEIFRPAIQRNCPAIVVCHNHPSGCADPSPDDICVTRAIFQAGKLLDISLLDHIVIGGSRWTSLKERGLGFV
jgi:DNA repair protein RadC